MAKSKQEQIEELANQIQRIDFAQKDILKGKVYSVISFEKCANTADKLISLGYIKKSDIELPKESKVSIIKPYQDENYARGFNACLSQVKEMNGL